MSDSRIVYTPRTETSEAEPDVLVSIYELAIRRFEEQKEAGPATGPDAAMKGSKDDRDMVIVPEKR